jgi:Domain of Unknown Function (DUF1080)
MTMTLPRTVVFIGCLLSAMMFAAGGATAQDTTIPPGMVPGMPVMLFDGRSLDGWGRRDGSANPGWDVEEGALHRKSGGGDLYYKYELADFELHFQWRIAPGGNSGLKYRLRDYDGSWLGCEYQLLDDDKHGDANKTAGLYDVIDPPDYTPIVKPDVWNYSRIVVCGNHIEHWLNGVQTVSVTVGSNYWKSSVAASKFANYPGFGENRTGRLFLQDHGDEVWFRGIVLVPLDCPTSMVGVMFEPSGCHCENSQRLYPQARPVSRFFVSVLPSSERRFRRCRRFR